MGDNFRLHNGRLRLGHDLPGHDPSRCDYLRPLHSAAHAQGLLSDEALSLGGDLPSLLGLALDLVLIQNLLHRDLLAQCSHNLFLSQILNAFALRSSGHEVYVRHLKQLFDDQLPAPVAIGKCGHHLLGAEISYMGGHIGPANGHSILYAIFEKIEHICSSFHHQDCI